MNYLYILARDGGQMSNSLTLVEFDLLKRRLLEL
jgi:hypothetical protein